MDVTDESPSEDYKIAKVTMHKDYNRKSFDNDIALLTLERDVVFTGEYRGSSTGTIGAQFLCTI